MSDRIIYKWFLIDKFVSKTIFKIRLASQPKVVLYFQMT